MSKIWPCVWIGNRDADRRGVVRGVVDETDAAQPVLRLAAAEGRLDLEARRQVLQAVDLVDASVLERRGRQHGERDADGLGGLGAPLRRHHHLLEPAGVSSALPRRGVGAGGTERARDGEREDGEELRGALHAWTPVDRPDRRTAAAGANGFWQPLPFRVPGRC